MIDLKEQLERWLAEGIISPEQAELMSKSATEPGASQDLERSPESPSRIPIVAEILGYVGAALATWAVVFLVSEFWGNLADWAQVGLFGALAVLLFVAGTLLVDVAEPALRRLSGVLWAGSVVATGGALFVVFDHMAGFDPAVSGLWIGLVAAVVGGAMLWRTAAVIQHTVLFVAVMTIVVSLLSLGPEPEIFYYGLAVWGVGLSWVLVTRSGLLAPLNAGMVLGSLAMLYGAQLTLIEDGYQSGNRTAGVLLALLTAAALATGGIMLRDKLTIILGGIGIFVFVPQAMFHFFGEALGGMFGLFLSGLILVGLAVWFGRHREAV